MAHSVAEESFTHQLPVTFDQVHNPDPTWSDRCYFFAAAPDGSLLLASGYGNNPNTGTGVGYVKVSMADGRHWDLLAGDGQLLADMYHMKEPGRWTGWVEVDARRISVDGFHGGRDRTFGVRVADKIDFWLWLDADFGDCAVEAWIIESADDTTLYVDGGIIHNVGTLSKRFVKIEHDVEFAGDRKRPARAALVFTDEDGSTYRLGADTPHQAVNAYYGLPMDHC